MGAIVDSISGERILLGPGASSDDATREQRYPTSSPEFYYSSIYTSITFLLVLISWSSTLWTNKPWRTTNSLVHIFGGPAIDWSGQIVVVTGGASGIGKVLVETLTMMRVTVVVIDRDEFKGDSGQ